MKTILSILFTLCACFAFAQDSDTTLTRSDFSWIQTDDKAWTFHYVTDTIDASADDDTTRIILPHEFGTAFVGVLFVQVDTISGEGEDILTGSYVIIQSQCLDTCPYDEESNTLPEDAGMSSAARVIIAIRDKRMWIDLISTDGIGVLSIWLTLKPSSIPAE